VARRTGNASRTQTRIEKKLVSKMRGLEIVGQGIGRVGW
jgi:hypothetical protein